MKIATMPVWEGESAEVGGAVLEYGTMYASYPLAMLCLLVEEV